MAEWKWEGLLPVGWIMRSPITNFISVLWSEGTCLPGGWNLRGSMGYLDKGLISTVVITLWAGW